MCQECVEKYKTMSTDDLLKFYITSHEIPPMDGLAEFQIHIKEELGRRGVKVGIQEFHTCGHRANNRRRGDKFGRKTVCNCH